VSNENIKLRDSVIGRSDEGGPGSFWAWNKNNILIAGESTPVFSNYENKSILLSYHQTNFDSTFFTFQIFTDLDTLNNDKLQISVFNTRLIKTVQLLPDGILVYSVKINNPVRKDYLAYFKLNGQLNWEKETHMIPVKWNSSNPTALFLSKNEKHIYFSSYYQERNLKVLNLTAIELNSGKTILESF
jgi:hypothetical protein